MTLQTSFQSGVVTGRDERPIPAGPAQETKIIRRQTPSQALAELDILAERLHDASEQAFSVEETTTELGDSLICTLNSNTNVSITITATDEAFEITCTGLADTKNASFAGAGRSIDTQETFVRWVGRTCPNKKNEILAAIRTLREEQTHTAPAASIDLG